MPKKKPYRTGPCEKCGEVVWSGRTAIICPACRHRAFLDRVNLRRKHGKGHALQRWEANGGRCWWCGEPVPLDKMQADHIVPVSQGGGGGANMVPSCAPCNRAKSNGPAPALALGAVG